MKMDWLWGPGSDDDDEEEEEEEDEEEEEGFVVKMSMKPMNQPEG